MTIRSQAARLLRRDFAKDPNGFARELAAMLRSPDVTQQLEVGITGTNGQAALGADYACTNSMANVGLSVKLAEAGTYLLLATVATTIATAGGPSEVLGQLYDSTAGAAVSGVLPLAQTETGAARDTTTVLPFFHTAKRANTTINLQAYKGVGSFGVCTVKAGNTALAYVKLG
jgi:hypothetical protein